MTDARGLFEFAVPDARPVVPADVVPEPELGDIFAAERDIAIDEVPGMMQDREDRAFADLARQVSSRTGRDYAIAAPGGGMMSQRVFRRQELWRDLAEIRAREPGYLRGGPTNDDELQRETRARYARRRAENRRVADQAEGAAGLAAGFAGSVTGTLVDPINVLTMPFGGGGRTVVQIFAREALLNGLLEAAELPAIASERAKLDDPLTAEEAIANVGIGAVAGGVLGVAPKLVGDAWKAIADRVRPFDAKLADAIAKAEPTDLDLARATEFIVGDRATPDQRAAMAAIRREAELVDASPFVAGPAGDDAHAEALASIEAMLRDLPEDDVSMPSAVTGRETAAVPRETSAAMAVPPPPSITMPPPPAVGSTDSRATVKARIGRVENATGGLDVRNPNSTATGPYQFTRGTWIAAYKQRFGAGGLTDDQIWAKRSESRQLHEALMDELIQMNARSLARAGLPETAGNLYLSHFAGSDGAVRLLTADPDTPVERVLGKQAVAANRSILEGRTVGEVVAWAHRKMGEAVIGGADRVRLDPQRFADEDALRAAQARIDAIEMEKALRLAQSDPAASDAPRIDLGEDAAVDIPDVELAAWEVDAPAADPRTAPETDAPPADLPAADRETINRLADRVIELERQGRSLNVAKLAKALDTDEATVRRALIAAVGRPASNLQLRRDGRVVRKPRALAPKDMLRFLAERGGLRDDEGHDIARTIGRKFVPQVGPLPRPNGMSIHDAAEALWEAQYFLDEPSASDILEALDRSIRRGKRIYSVENLNEGIDYEMRIDQAGQTEAARAEAEAALARLVDDDAVDEDLIMDVMQLTFGGMEAEEAAALAIDYRIRTDAVMLHELSGKPLNERVAALDDDAFAAPDGDRSAAAIDDGYDAARGSAGTGAPDAEAGDWPNLDELERVWRDPGLIEAVAREFDDPNGKAAAAQAESIEHDVAVELDRGAEADPAIAERQRREAELRAASPMQGRVDQDGTIGLGLFDAVDQPSFRLDEEGGEVSARDLLARIDRDQAELDAIKACMTPPKRGGDGGGA